MKPGRSIRYRRDPNYWGADLPVNRGRYNFDEVLVDYYRESGSMFEAFKSGAIDVRPEDDPVALDRRLRLPGATPRQRPEGGVSIGTPSGMSALVFNTWWPIFADKRVREALIKLFDFEWINRNLYHGQYARTESYFDRSELSSHWRAADAQPARIAGAIPGRGEAQIWRGPLPFP